MFNGIFQQAIYALIGHRLRALMTMFGVAWGIVAVVLLMAYGNGLHTALFLGLHGGISYGTIVVWGNQTSLQEGGERAGRWIRLDESDVDAVRGLQLVKYASPEYTFSKVPLTNGNRNTSARVRGIAPEYAAMRSETPQLGRFINTDDLEKRRRVVFLGVEVARKLFGNGPAVGQTVQIKGLPFEVIGVMANKVQLLTYEAHDRYCAFIPYTTVKQLWNQDYLSYLVFQTTDPGHHDQTLRQVRKTLALRHNFDPRDERAIRVIMDSVENNRLFGAITDMLKIILGFIGALTLLI